MISPTERFSNRVDYYTASRPSYPPQVIQLLRDQCGLRAGCVVADIGSGTGILTRLLLQCGALVFAVEPNDNMRAAAEHALGGHQNFQSIAASAEQTELPTAAVEIITAAQAFHWFDHRKARREFARILRPAGWVALIWNQRKTSTPEQRTYEKILDRHAKDYRSAERIASREGSVDAFFAPHECQKALYANHQKLNFRGLQDRILSASYSPKANDPEFPAMLADLRRMFDEFADNGCVTLAYDTKIYYGHLN